MANDRKALLVGINKYRNYPQSNLNGCVNDTGTMSAYLVDYKGFEPGDIMVLTDDQATKANIMGELQGMVDEAKASKLKQIVFALSGHGTQVPDMEDEEKDDADEAFCPHDLDELNGNWDPDHIIVDDELNDMFVQLPKGVKLEVYLDTCHSGTGLKALDLAPGRKIKYLPPPSVSAFVKAIRADKAHSGNGSRQKAVKASHALWSACKAIQTSADASIGGSWHGAFTYYFYEEVKACNNTLKPKSLLSKVRKSLKANHFEQVPEYDAKATTR